MECSKQVILEYYTTFTGFNEVNEMKHSMLYLYTILNWLYIKKGKQIIIFCFNCVIHGPWLLGNQGLKVTPLYGCVTQINQKLRIPSLYLIYNLPGVQKCISLACHWYWCNYGKICQMQGKRRMRRNEKKKCSMQHMFCKVQRGGKTSQVLTQQITLDLCVTGGSKHSLHCVLAKRPRLR